MSDWGDTETAAQELIAAAQRRGIDLASLCSHSQFLYAGRYIHLWRQGEQYCYYIQGSVGVLPVCLKGSEGAFHGVWCESGKLRDIEQAIEFVRAWLLRGTEVDQLPARSIRSYGI